MRRSMLMSLGLALTTAGTLAAQAPGKGSVDLGLFGRYATYPTDMNADPGMGGGARLGFYFGGGIAAELDYSFVMGNVKGNDNEDILDRPLRARLAYHRPMSAGNKLILGAGYTKENVDAKSTPAQSMTGLGLLVGFQHDFNESMGLRVEGTYDMFGDGGALPAGTSGGIIGIDVGLNWFFGNGPAAPRDGDKDGVTDDVDACPGTPAGERVDARGCVLPKDADRDGVIDANDACPGTMAGDRVDARGCSLPKDADNDGVTDNNDRCAGTPAGTPVDANGCPRDTDGDGVTDNNDRCAGTPAGTPVDANGCPRDSDADGVADSADRCPGTPAGTKVDAAGCPLPDTDGDKVVDRDDKCPNTPAGMAVDANGCQQLFNQAAGQTSIVLEGVTFRSGSSAITPTSRPILDRVAEALVNNPSYRVEVQGHTDNSGAVATNTRLSQARANSVRAYLISKGVDGGRLTAVGYGPTQPKVPNTSAANRAQNRRVELKQIP
ncbi:MAG TPA: OmpA family protein [Gemmatimonadales bacterium]|nr:OmpA family protein [Gemmatimonadales bacterium]